MKPRFWLLSALILSCATTFGGRLSAATQTEFTNTSGTFVWTHGGESKPAINAAMSGLFEASLSVGDDLDVSGPTMYSNVPEATVALMTYRPHAKNMGCVPGVMVEYRLTFKEGLVFTPESVVFDAVKEGTDNAYFSWAYAIDENSEILKKYDSPKTQIRRNNNANPEAPLTHTETISSEGGEVFSLRFYISNVDSTKKMSIGNLKIMGKVSGSAVVRGFADFALDFTSDPYTVTQPIDGLPSGVTVDGTWHDAQHGYNTTRVTVPVDGPVKISIGNCTYSNLGATVSTSAGRVLFAFDCTDDCTGQTTVTYNSLSLDTLVITTPQYCPSLSVEACELEVDYDEEADCYLLSTADHLYWFAEKVNSGKYSLNAKLTADITVNENVLDTDGHLNGNGAGFRVWTPIGVEDLDEGGKCYTGTFDGQGHTIRGLFFNGNIDYDEITGVGLIGAMDHPGVIRNVEVADTYFSACAGVAGICGSYYGGRVENCYNAGTISGIECISGICGACSGAVEYGDVIVNCGNAGSIKGTYAVGGVCGDFWLNPDKGAYMENCYNTGSVTGADSEDVDSEFIGGIVGLFYGGRIVNCYNTGSVVGEVGVGGVCGTSDGRFMRGGIINCYNTASVTGDEYVGGVCAANVIGLFSNCYNTGLVSGTSYIGGVCGYNDDDIANCYYLQGTCADGIPEGQPGEAFAKTAAAFAGGEVAWLLNEAEAGESPAWRQTIGVDTVPVLEPTQGIVVKATTTGLNSIIRPTAGALVGATKVYNFAGIRGTDVYGVEYTDSLLAANHPYVFTSNKVYVSFVPSDEAVSDDTDTFGLSGVLEADGQRVYGQGNTAGESVSLVFTSSAMKYANPNGNLVKYGKCYVDAGQAFVLNAPILSCPLPVAFENQATELDGLEAPETAVKYYNLMGVEVGEDYQGIVIFQGKKQVRP